MTLSRGDKIVENLTGTGQVRGKGKVIAKAEYSLYIEAEEITARSFGTNEARFHRRSVSGETTILDGAMLPGDDPTAPSGSFTLVLEDGREVDFRVESCTVESDPVRQVCQIQGSGNKL